MTLTAHDLHISYGSETILAGAALSMAPGEMVGLIGPNGAGKSTLLRCLAGLTRPRRGRVTLSGRPLDGVPRRELARHLGFLAQSGAVHWPLTVERLVLLGRLPHLGPWQRPGPADLAAVDRALTQCDVLDLRHRNVMTLSGGERARALLARALAAEPALLLADEPVAGLDPYHQLQVMELLNASAAAGTGILVVLHDLTLAARFCNRIALLNQGRIVADGPPAEVLRPEWLEAAYHVRMAEVRLQGHRLQLPWSRLPQDPLP